MYVTDHEGQILAIDRQDDLLAFIRSVRKGPYGAFILWHGTTGKWDDDAGPSLLVLINNDVAHLYFIPGHNREHPGFHPTGMSPADCPESVHFMQTDGFEAAGITMERDTLVSVDVAYKAATEFLKEPVLPGSISWFEL